MNISLGVQWPLSDILELFFSNFLRSTVLIRVYSEGQSQPPVIYWTVGNYGKSIFVSLLLYMITALLITAHFSLHPISSHLPFPPTISCQMDI